MQLVVLSSILDRVLFNVNLMFLVEILARQHPGKSNYVLLVAVVLHHILAAVPIALWRLRRIKSTYYKWICFNAILYSIWCTIGAIDSSQSSPAVAFFVISGLFRLEPPVTLYFFYGNQGRSTEALKYNNNTSELAFGIGEVCSIQAISQIWTYPTETRMYMIVLNLILGVLVTGSYAMTQSSLEEKALDDSTQITDGHTQTDVTALLLSEEEEDESRLRSKEEPEELQQVKRSIAQRPGAEFTILEQVVLDPIPGAGVDQAALAQMRVQKALDLASLLVFMAGFCAFSLYSFFAYMAAFILYHSDFGTPAFAFVGILFFVTMMIAVRLSFRRITMENLPRRFFVCLVALVCCAVASWVLFIVEKNQPSRWHMVIHWFAMISISFILSAPVNVLIDLQQKAGLQHICYADVLTLNRLGGRMLGLCITWAGTFYLHMAPYFFVAFLGWHLYRSLDRQIRSFNQ